MHVQRTIKFRKHANSAAVAVPFGAQMSSAIGAQSAKISAPLGQHVTSERHDDGDSSEATLDES
jgi:hypothetical protein